MPGLLGSFRSTDDRGTPIRVPMPYAPAPDWLTGKTPASALKLRRQVLWATHIAQSWLVRACLFALAALMTVWFVLEWVRRGEDVLSLALVVFAWFLAAAWPAWVRFESRGWCRKAPLSLPICAVCAYELVDLAPEPDGCTVCPECGAAWRLDAQSPNNAPGEGA